jgi:hypothetical protein
MSQVSGMIVIPASLRSDFIHIAGMPIHIPLESIIHIAGIRTNSMSSSSVGSYVVQMMIVDLKSAFNAIVLIVFPS